MDHYNKKYTELSMHTAHNKRVCGSLRSPKPFATLRASHTRRTLYEIARISKGKTLKAVCRFK